LLLAAVVVADPEVGREGKQIEKFAPRSVTITQEAGVIFVEMEME
jgi:hypothetical protein